MKNHYTLCKDCKKRIYYIEEKGTDRFWCPSCYERKLANPIFQCELSKKDFDKMMQVLETASCDALYNWWFNYDDSKNELKVISQ